MSLQSLTGPAADGYALGLLALALAAVGIYVLRRWPRLIVVSYLLVLCFVPIWVSLQLKVTLEPQMLWGLVVLVALLSLGRLGVRLTALDGLVAAFALVCLAPAVLGGTSAAFVFDLVSWLGAFLVGRLIGHAVSYEWCLRVIAVVFTVVAVLAVAEYLTAQNLFLDLPGSHYLYAQWGTLQERGGVLRAEGAFGHSIALGAALAMAVPLTLGTSFRPGVRVAMVVAMLAGVTVTFSRIALVAAAFGAVLSILALRAEMPVRLRVLLTGGVAAGAAAVAPVLLRVFGQAGDEASTSVSYRGDLLSLVGDMRALGLSSAYHRSLTGQGSFGDFPSIDSALLLQGLSYGWLSLVLVLILLASALVVVVTRRASAPAIALVAQIPALATVALITQYSTMVWFVAGLAVHAATGRPVPGEQVPETVAARPSNG